MKKNYLGLALCICFFFPTLSYSQGFLENPVADSTESGIGVISGWHCTADNITASIDGIDLGKAGSGTSRNDTKNICGKSDTGFSLLLNYNELTPGVHSINVYADGELLTTREFKTVRSGGAPFFTGPYLYTIYNTPDWPSAGKTAKMEWSQAKQSFVITEISGGTSVDMSFLEGSWGQVSSIFASGSQCKDYGIYSTSAVYIKTLISVNNNTVSAQAITSGDTCSFNLTYVSGDSSSGFNLTGSATCNSGLSSNNVEAKGIKCLSCSSSLRRLVGTITMPVSGCTETINLN